MASKPQDFELLGQGAGLNEDVWLLEELWTDYLENDYAAARGYKPIGYVLSEDAANAAIVASGSYSGRCWAVPKGTPKLRKVRLPRLLPP